MPLLFLSSPSLAFCSFAGHLSLSRSQLLWVISLLMKLCRITDNSRFSVMPQTQVRLSCDAQDSLPECLDIIDGNGKAKRESLKLDARYVCSQETYTWVSLTHVSTWPLLIVFLLFLLLVTICKDRLLLLS